MPVAETVEMTGGVRSALLTVTATAAEVVELPAASRATAVRACDPFALAEVFHGTE